jgi:hypothetical protein
MVNCFLCITVGIEQPDETELIIYPNPAYENIHIKFPGSFNLTVFSSAGEQVFQKKDCCQSANLSLQDFPGGIYYILLTAGERKIFRKVVMK